VTCGVYTKIAVMLDIDASRRNIRRLAAVYGKDVVKQAVKIWRMK
jgi:hypothetical protein